MHWTSIGESLNHCPAALGAASRCSARSRCAVRVGVHDVACIMQIMNPSAQVVLSLMIMLQKAPSYD
jgi:hypothetical protein